MEDTIEVGQAKEESSTKEQERSKIVANLKKEQEKGKVLYAETDNFIVVYRDIPKIYRKFDSWLDTHPRALAQHLEIKLEEAKEHFQFDIPDTFQVVEVKSGGLLLGGYHTGKRRGILSLKEWEHARYSKVFSEKRKDAFVEPAIYSTAVHEAIGHGIIDKELIGEYATPPYKRKPELNFLIEAIATYTEYTLSGADPHDYFRDAMREVALLQFAGLDGKWKLGSLTEEQTRKRVKKVSKAGVGFSVSEVFKLKGDGLKDAESVKPKDGDNLNDLFARYSRGGSFVKFMVDRYGIETFKRWTSQLNSSDFFESLEQVTGKTVSEIEREWKDEVLTDLFLDNPITEERERGLREETKRERAGQRKLIMDLYRKYS